MKTKNFDCVEMKRRGSAALYEKIKEMTIEEQLDFWHKGTEKLCRKQKNLSKHSASQ